jgi:hypothetical protein
MLAQEFLDNKAANRRLNENRALEYALAMEAGEWRLTHQGFAFNNRGQLVDGQTRCLAITLAKKSIKVMVTYGLSDAEVLAIDQGRMRTAADSISIFRKTPVSAASVATARAAMRYSTFYCQKTGVQFGNPVRLPYAEVDAFLRLHEEGLSTISGYRTRAKNLRLANAIVGAVLLRATYHLSGSRLRSLMEILATGIYEDKDTDSAALMVRNRLLDQRYNHTQLANYFHIERGFQAFHQGVPVKKIHSATRELFPLPEEGATPVQPRCLARLEARRAAKAQIGCDTKARRMAAESASV